MPALQSYLHWNKVIWCKEAIESNAKKIINLYLSKGLVFRIRSFWSSKGDSGWDCLINLSLYKRSIKSQKGFMPVPPAKN